MFLQDFAGGSKSPQFIETVVALSFTNGNGMLCEAVLWPGNYHVLPRA